MEIGARNHEVSGPLIWFEQRMNNHIDWLVLQTRVSELTSNCNVFLTNHCILGGELMHKCSYVYKILAPALLNKIIRST